MEDLKQAQFYSINGKQCDFACTCSDDYMAPTIQNGDTVFFAKTQEAADGSIILYRIDEKPALAFAYQMQGGICAINGHGSKPIMIKREQIEGVAIGIQRIF